jgi:hypothetical protein
MDTNVSTLKTKVEDSSETLVHTCKNIQCYIPGDHNHNYGIWIDITVNVVNGGKLIIHVEGNTSRKGS